MAKAKSSKPQKPSARQRIARQFSRAAKAEAEAKVGAPSFSLGGVVLRRDATEASRVIGGPAVAPPYMRKFTVKVELEFDVRVARSLIDAVLEPEWQGRFYVLPKPENVVEHLVYNYLRGEGPTTLDGFADRSPYDVEIGGGSLFAHPFREFTCEVAEVEE